MAKHVCASRSRSPPSFIVRRTSRNEQMGGYIVAGSTFRFRPSDGRSVRFPAISALRVDFVRYLRVDAQDLQLRRTHECTVNASSSTPAPLPHAVNWSLSRPILLLVSPLLNLRVADLRAARTFSVRHRTDVPCSRNQKGGSASRPQETPAYWRPLGGVLTLRASLLRAIK
jgi:hypothetical protein